MTPNHSVLKRIIMVVPAAISLVIPFRTSKPVILPSATSIPPGIRDTAPAKEEKEKTKVLKLEGVETYYGLSLIHI